MKKRYVAAAILSSVLLNRKLASALARREQEVGQAVRNFGLLQEQFERLQRRCDWLIETINAYQATFDDIKLTEQQRAIFQMHSRPLLNRPMPS